MSQLGSISVRTSARLSSSSRRLQPGRPRSRRPTQAGIRHDRVLPLDAVLRAPGAEAPHEAVGDLDRPGLPVPREGLVAPAERLVELRHREAIEVHETGRVVDDQPDRDPRARVEHRDLRRLPRPIAWNLCRGTRGSQAEHARRRGRFHVAQKLSPAAKRHMATTIVGQIGGDKRSGAESCTLASPVSAPINPTATLMCLYNLPHRI